MEQEILLERILVLSHVSEGVKYTLHSTAACYNSQSNPVQSTIKSNYHLAEKH